jgi:hypothetical protein
LFNSPFKDDDVRGRAGGGQAHLADNTSSSYVIVVRRPIRDGVEFNCLIPHLKMTMCEGAPVVGRLTWPTILAVHM